MKEYSFHVTVYDAVHAGIRLGIGQTRTLEIWRAMGGEIRDIDFARAWRDELERFGEWSRQRRATN